jgi:hypothetical protein
MRRTILAIACLVTPALLGCQADHTAHCTKAYAHLISLAKRRVQPKQRERFVARCRASWDEKRQACLLQSTTSAQAQRCRVERVRPG